MKNTFVSQSSIKWIRLKEVCEQTLRTELPEEQGLVVNIIASTDIEMSLRAAVERTGGIINIALNFFYNKDLKEVVDSLAHELTHVVLHSGGEYHTAPFRSTTRRLARGMMVSYLAQEKA